MKGIRLTVLCHTSQGFRERIVTGAETTADVIHDPSNINCYTCHDIHDTYTVADWTLRVTDAVTFWASGNTYDFGKGNICASCHQARPADMPDVNNPEGIFTVDNSRWGPHHGPQSSLFAGDAAFKIGSGYDNNPHAAITDACVTCHMADAFGGQAGGHTWNMSYLYHGSEEYNTAGCVECHSDPTQKIEDLKVEIQGKLDVLQALLDSAGIYNANNQLANTGDFPNVVAGAYYNFEYIGQDRSFGVHNPSFTKTLLDNSISALEARK
jgi:formate-dependent nitrite reductase cytochrome c552 subunit